MSMPPSSTPGPDAFDERSALDSLVRGTATETGARFFAVLVESLARALGTYAAWVTEYLPGKHSLRAHALWLDGKFVDGYEQAIAGTPCQAVIEEQRLVFYPDRVVELFAEDPGVQAHRFVSYLGVPLKDLDGTILGHLAVLDQKPMVDEPRVHALFQIFAGRAAAELRRLRAERDVRERQQRLQRLVESAFDTIVELDAALRVTLLNPAGERALGASAADLVGRDFGGWLVTPSRTKLTALVAELDARPEGQRSLWIAGGLDLQRADGVRVHAEATLARSDLAGQAFYTLVLRDESQRLDAERRIAALTEESQVLREELRALGHRDIVGESPALVATLRDVSQVAPTDSTVLILGETGTGKELIARAIHEASRRRERPLVRVNCAAIPANLIESELFGHERGAFTGATSRRIGRFALADGGTIFLDEIGELPLELQAKLLRVLQEGELEAVGSSRTQKVDVRVIAATNRDLAAEVRERRFREDLFHRLDVFPLRVPPLRERGDDVIRLAARFADEASRRLGRRFAPLSPAQAQRLRAYTWPGNVRELENVIERAAITARGAELNLGRALPETEAAAPIAPEAPAAPPARILTAAEMEAHERTNLVRALDACDWRVSGDRGAAALLGMKPSTLSSRIKALGLTRSRDLANPAHEIS
jgi:PAS domain S-box-containing protein